MKELHFSKKYFQKQVFEDIEAKVRVEVSETPSLNITEEEYSLRVTTRYEDPDAIHRNYAIEHHMPPSRHNFPHLQFKFHTEEIGQFRIRIDIEDSDDYKRAILGFIYKIKNVLEDLERLRKGITNEVLVLQLVNQLEKEGDFLSKKISDGIKKYSLEFNEKRGTKDKLSKLSKNPLLLDFLGKENMQMLSKG